MNQVAPQAEAPARAPVVAGGNVLAIIPQSLDEVWRLSTAIAAAPGMAPRGMEKPEQIMVAIMAGSELGMPPFQALQSFAVVNGRPTLWGDGLMAVVKARGVKVREWFEHEDDAEKMRAMCEVTRPDNGEVTLGSFSVGDAKKAGLWSKQGPWQQYPKRMLKMRARVALRDGCADMLRGFQIREEVEDYRDVTPVRAGTGLAARLKGAPPASADGFTRSIEHQPSDVSASTVDSDTSGGSSATTRLDEAGLEGPAAPAIDTDLSAVDQETVLAWVAVYRAAFAAAGTPEDAVAIRKSAFDGGQLKAVHGLDPQLQVQLDVEIRQRAEALKAPAGDDDFPGDRPMQGDRS